MTRSGVATVVKLAFNTSTEHITISSGFRNHAKYRAEHHEEKVRYNREYGRTHRKERALYRLCHRVEIGEYNHKYRVENQDKITALGKASQDNPERKRRTYVRNRDRYHIKLTGVCSICRMLNDTERHHLWYPDIFDPNAVIEVCKKCHYAIESENYLKSIGVQQCTI